MRIFFENFLDSKVETKIYGENVLEKRENFILSTLFFFSATVTKIFETI